MNTGLLFRAEQVYKSFGVTKALKGMHLELRRGQILGLIGENGSGTVSYTHLAYIISIKTASVTDFDRLAY